MDFHLTIIKNYIPFLNIGITGTSKHYTKIKQFYYNQPWHKHTWNETPAGHDDGGSSWKYSSVASSLSHDPSSQRSRYSSGASMVWPTRRAHPTGCISGESSWHQKPLSSGSAL